jgi:hypothetical protein
MLLQSQAWKHDSPDLRQALYFYKKDSENDQSY